MVEMIEQRRWKLICGIIAGLLLLVFIKNAWVCDDAYIIFRSIEQLYAGNGPNWNPHERVQAYTSPLWYWLLVLPRAVSSDHFFNFFLLSLVIFLILGLRIRRYFGDSRSCAIFLCLAAGSNAFFDFTTSGLENILAYLLTTLAFLYGLEALRADPASPQAEAFFRRSLWAFALLPVCRHDLVLVGLLPALVLIRHFRGKGRSPAGSLLLLFGPLLAWSAFSLTYYGALFPNTAYAKLSTGISRWPLLRQGFYYFWETFVGDPLTMLVIAGGLVAAAFDKRPFMRSAAVAAGLYLLYILWAGGDFMRGRFFSVPFLVALILFVESGVIERLFAARAALARVVPVVLLAYLLLFPHTPINTWLGFQDFSVNNGIADERGYYFDVCSLYAYLHSGPGEIFPDFEWSQIGRQIAENGVGYLENDFNGMLGFWAGVKPIIVDRLALTDPFLARQPVSAQTAWRVGHYKRAVPAEYRSSLENGRNMFSDTATAALYDKILLATREPQIFSFKRLLAIVKLNLGIN
ncbi:MAG TPA: hypothetical protein PLK58_10370 [Candidatus Rifleibacterium sp.]|nr:hypothetical protein [Candidatus Rifleibacterium sp.]